ncbi:MAG: ATP-binding domain-containing protein, partial [Rhodocyclaceae bacterium]|nr:ATP-binding domain-containing protein [Rhodocyclaceae bacterium]
RAWWLQDPMQNLYGRPEVPLPGWTSLRSEINYRTPRGIVDTLNRMLPLPYPMEPGSPVDGYEVEILTYADTAELIAKTITAVTRCIGLGFRRSHVAVVTYRGRESSRLAPFDRLGPYPLRAPTGRYDLLGNPTVTEGDVLIDSVHRFKGQAAPCVVLTEIDFDTLDERAVRRIFVGATRATMKLVLVASEASAKTLQARLDGWSSGLAGTMPTQP